jgi:uracil phosphoribosyltransferase
VNNISASKHLLQLPGAKLDQRTTSKPIANMNLKVQILQHPLVKEKLSNLRDKNTSSTQFRSTLSALSSLLAMVHLRRHNQKEASRDLTIVNAGLRTSPMCEYDSEAVKERVAIFPILRAGLGIPFDSITIRTCRWVSFNVSRGLQNTPHWPLYLYTHSYILDREKATFTPVEYYNKLPSVCTTDVGYVLDPMIATAGTAIAAVSILKDWGLKNIKFCAVVASRTGLDALVEAHPDIDIFVCAVDEVFFGVFNCIQDSG